MPPCIDTRQQAHEEPSQAKFSKQDESDEDSGATSTSSHQACNPSTCNRMPAYPFYPDVRLDMNGSAIDVLRHTCRQHPRGVKGILILLPGVHGGVGPCRQPGQIYDEHCLYALLSARLHELDAPVDIFRCSWPFMRPDMADAVKGVCRVLHCALLSAKVAGCKSKRKVKVVLVGHSLGGAVAMNCATYLCEQFGPDGKGCRDVQSLEKATVQMAGLCTLNGALSISSMVEANLGALKSVRALVVSGDADQVVPPESSVQLHEVLKQSEVSARHLSLPGGTHDLFDYKDRLVDVLSKFTLRCLNLPTSQSEECSK